MTSTEHPTSVYLVDGTYELFRHFYGRSTQRSNRPEVAATRGVLGTVIGHLERGVTHVGVATDHVIESFRNDLWPGYKRGEGIPDELFAQFPLVERCLEALGIVVWAMVEVEADDALASAAAVAADDARVDRVVICTPDKDLAQCVQGQRVVQWDSRKDATTDEDGVHERYGVWPATIPDWLALVGDSADGFPGLPGWGKVSASAVLDHYGHLDDIPDAVADWDSGLRDSVRGAARLAEALAAGRELAELFRHLATLRIDRSLVGSVEDLRWSGPTAAWHDACTLLGDQALERRVDRLVAEG